MNEDSRRKKFGEFVITMTDDGDPFMVALGIFLALISFAIGLFLLAVLYTLFYHHFMIMTIISLIVISMIFMGVLLVKKSRKWADE